MRNMLKLTICVAVISLPSLALAQAEHSGGEKSAADLNAAAAAAAATQTHKIMAQKQAQKAAERKAIDDAAKSKADYDAQVEAMRRRNAEKTAAYEARMVTYRACVAGDKAACKRVDAGQ